MNRVLLINIYKFSWKIFEYRGRLRPDYIFLHLFVIFDCCYFLEFTSTLHFRSTRNIATIFHASDQTGWFVSFDETGFSCTPFTLPIFNYLVIGYIFNFLFPVFESHNNVVAFVFVFFVEFWIELLVENLGVCGEMVDVGVLHVKQKLVVELLGLFIGCGHHV